MDRGTGGAVESQSEPVAIFPVVKTCTITFYVSIWVSNEGWRVGRGDWEGGWRRVVTQRLRGTLLSEGAQKIRWLSNRFDVDVDTKVCDSVQIKIVRREIFSSANAGVLSLIHLF